MMDSMDSAVMIAQVFGPLMGIMGLWMLLYGENMVKVMTALKGSPLGLYASAFVNLLIGLFIINSFNSWEWNIYFFVTLLGWVSFIRGVLTLFMPQVIIKAFMQKSTWVKTMGIIPFVWGLILIFVGFYM